MRKITTGILAVSMALLAGCSSGFDTGFKSDSSKPIVKVNDGVITQKMYDSAQDSVYNSSILAVRNIDLKDPKNKTIATMLKGQVINELIIKSLVFQEAKKRNIEVSKKDLDKAIDEIAQKAGGKEKLEATLTLKNISKKDFVENIRIDLVTRKLVESLTLGLNIGDNEAKKFYDDNRTTKFKTPDVVGAQHILVAASPADIKAKVQIDNQNKNLSEAQINQKVGEELAKAKAKAENILAQLKANPTKFAELAKTSSDDPSSAEKGGDLGYFKKEDMVPEFSKAAFSLAPGQLSNVVQTNFGFHIIKVSDRKKAGIVPYIEIKEEIKKYLANEKNKESMIKLITNARNSAKIEYLDKQYDLNAIQKEVKEAAKTAKINL